VTGRLNLEGVPTSGRVIRDLIKKGKLKGWDDPRLTTLLALRRRGFLPEAIKEFLLRTGVSKAEATLTWDILEAINRKFVDPLANRYFCIIDPVKIEIQGIKVKEVEVALHPEFPRRGKRKIPVDVKEVYVERNDFNRFKGKEVGLMYFCTVKLGKKAKFVSKQIKIETPKIHWVSKPLQVKLVLSDGKVKDALAEASVKKLRVGTRIQMPRVGFCILDQVKPEIVFYFTHP
jgi:glutamyl-tRNA synthetase